VGGMLSFRNIAHLKMKNEYEPTARTYNWTTESFASLVVVYWAARIVAALQPGCEEIERE